MKERGLPESKVLIAVASQRRARSFARFNMNVVLPERGSLDVNDKVVEDVVFAFTDAAYFNDLGIGNPEYNSTRAAREVEKSGILPEVASILEEAAMILYGVYRNNALGEQFKPTFPEDPEKEARYVAGAKKLQEFKEKKTQTRIQNQRESPKQHKEKRSGGQLDVDPDKMKLAMRNSNIKDIPWFGVGLLRRDGVLKERLSEERYETFIDAVVSLLQGNEISRSELLASKLDPKEVEGRAKSIYRQYLTSVAAMY